MIMLNNPALDVALGLVFIYAIYSLLATTLTELVSSLFNQRGKILRTGIRRMLDDDESIKQILKTETQGTSSDSQKTDSSNEYLPNRLSNEFFNLPEIKFLGKKGIFKKREIKFLWWNIKVGGYRNPSYIKPKTFSKGLVNLLLTVDMSDEKSKIKSLRDFDSSKGDKIFDFISEKLSQNLDTHKLIDGILSEADNNLDRFKSLAEDWFNDTMERVKGWYKRRIQLITFISGLLIAYSLNVNTVEISKILGKDEKARLAMVEAASGYVTSLNADTTKTSTTNQSIAEITDDIQAIISKSNKTQSIVNLTYPFCEQNGGITWWSYILGCFITAIALSIGSPFWFDLLNKLIQLRSSGSQEKSNSSSKSNPVG